jgi:hypothetical protein
MYYNRFPQLIIGGGLNSKTIAMIQAMTVAPSNIVVKALDDLIKDLFSYDLWDHFDQFWILSLHDGQAARLNLIDPSIDTLSISGSPVFSAYDGWTGVGTSGYLNAGRNMSDLVKYTQNNMHLGAWVGNFTANQNSMVIGLPTSNNLGIFPSYNGTPGNFYARTQSLSNSSLTLGNGGSGYFLIERNAASGATANTMYKNGSMINQHDTASAAVSAIPLRLLTGILGTNTTQLRIAHTGSYLGATKAANLHTAINSFLTKMDAL